MGFPKDFAWGVATAAYQIEGSPVRAGGGKSVWDAFCERKDAIANGESGFIACDHAERYRDDIALMKELGIKHYRLSVSWPRVLPDGVGRVNEQGLAFYEKLVDEMLAAGIVPWITLFHWDFPYELYLRGGWLNPDSSKWFADYARIVVDRLSDRVANWITLNEPQCFIGLGHMDGVHAPGVKLQLFEGLTATHNALLAHGRAVQVIRAGAKHPQTKVGYAPAGSIAIPMTDNSADVEAARTEMFKIDDQNHIWHNSWWMDPVYKGAYPEDGLAALGDRAPKIAEGDMEIIGQPVDNFCINIYQGKLIKAGPDGKPETVAYPPGTGRTAFGWPVTPSVLYWGARWRTATGFKATARCTIRNASTS
jgi:beta-glucosidase